MSVDQMRSAVIKVYTSEKWRQRVKEMPENQIIALYYKFLNAGKIQGEKRYSRFAQ